MARPSSKSSSGQDGSGRPAQPQTFLFVDSSESVGPDGAKQGRRNARSFVMQNARRQRPWSTSKQPGARARNARSATLSSPASGESSAKSKASPTPLDKTAKKNASKQHHGALSSDLSGSGERDQHCWQCHRPCVPGERLCQDCVPSTNIRRDLTFGPSSSSKMDPFSTLPTDLDPHSEALTSHCKLQSNHFERRARNNADKYKVFGAQTQNLLDIDIYHQSKIIRSSLFGLTMGSIAGMRATLCSSTIAHLAMGKASLADVLNRKCQLIADINQNLSDPLNGTHDSNIYAVATLITIEDALWDPRLKAQPEQAANVMRHRKIHFNGLKRMLEMRGGLAGLAENRCFQIMITW